MDFGHFILWQALCREYNEKRKIERRLLRDSHNPFHLSEDEFVRLFRITKQMCLDIVHVVEPDLRRKRSRGLPVHVEVLTAVRFFAVGSYQRGIGQNYYTAVGQTTVSKCILRISDIFVRKFFNKWIYFPATSQERAVVENDFKRKEKIPNCIGCIDCTQIPIFPPKDFAESYINRKGYHSINVQIICDVNCKILNVLAKFPGSVHDQFIFNESNVNAEMIRLYNNKIGTYYLIGDSGYALEPWLMTPISDAQENTAEYLYNKYIVKTRTCIERTNGILKAIFRCLSKSRVLHYEPIISAKIIITCCVLYNMMKHYKVSLETPVIEVEEQEIHEMPSSGPPRAAIQAQQNLIEYFTLVNT